EIQIKIARGFAVVARKNAETAGIIWNRFVKTEFGRKIRDRVLDRGAGPGFPVCAAASEILLEVLKNLRELTQEIFVLSKLFKARLPRKLQHAHRAMIGPVPEFGVELAE